MSVPRVVSAFSNRNYGFLWCANWIEYSTRNMQIVLLAWFVLDLTDSPFLVALVAFFGMAPYPLLGMVGGWLADRVNKRKLMIFSGFLGLCTALLMLMAISFLTIHFWYAYIVISVVGFATALTTPSRRSLYIEFLGPKGVTNGAALDGVGMQSSKMLGPIVAGGLIAFFGIDGGYLVISFLYFIGLILVCRIQFPHHNISSTVNDNGQILQNIKEGLIYALSNKIIFSTLLITIVMNMLYFPFQPMVPVIARDVLAVGPLLMGILFASEGFGAVLGSLLIASRSSIIFQGRYYILGSLLAAAGLLLFGISNSYIFAYFALLLAGIGVSGFATMQSTIVLITARDNVRGRALGVITLGIGTQPIGALIIGALASLQGPVFAVTIHATIGIILVCLVAIFFRNLWGKISADQTPYKF